MLMLIFMISIAGAVEWPTSIQRCLRSEPQLDKCLLRAAKQAVPRFAKGIAEIGVEALDPLTGANFTLGSDTGPVALRVYADHVNITGPSKIQIKKIIYNEKQSQLEVTGFHKLLKMSGSFNANGRILVFPINTKGYFTFDFREVNALHTVKIKRSLQERFNERSVQFSVNNLGKVIVNLKDVNHKNCNNLNRLVNDNWKIVTNAMIPSMETAIQRIYGRALIPLFDRFSLDDILPIA
ncbi:hypothetical protein O3M35_007988 [Rhynocoris fuscipes]|uniref:Protein takeout n=1 Tax=Rhynocoris fuscipes TaxID=488301 RepID=A0AAW1DGK2_9HEMI